MTHIYIPIGEEGFELCQPESPKDFERIAAEVNGVARLGCWQPIAMRLIHEDGGEQLSASDSPWLGSWALMFRRPAVSQLETILHQHGEVLPLRCAEAELCVFNATRVIDALDEEASALSRFPNGKLMRVKRHVFRAKEISGVDMFKIPNVRASSTFVSARFVQAWEAAGLRGLRFTEVWSDA